MNSTEIIKRGNPMHNRALDITSAIFLFMLAGFTIYHLPQAWRDEQAFNERVLRQGISRMHGQHVHGHEIVGRK